MSRELPHNRTAEEAVLGAVMLDARVLGPLADLLSESSFHFKQNAALWRAMLSISDRGEEIDVVTLEAELKAKNDFGLLGFEGLMRITDQCVTPSRAVQYAREVDKQARLRALALAAREVAEAACEAVDNADEFIADSYARISSVSETRTATGDLVSIGSYVNPSLTAIVDRAKAKQRVTGIPTGFIDLDMMTSGMHPGDLIILAARPSMGKTAMLLNILQHVAIPALRRPASMEPGTPCVLFEAEMSTPQLIERMLCAGAKVDSQKLRAGKMIESEFRSIVSVAELIYKAPIWVTDRSGPRIDWMRRQVSNARKRGRIPKGGPLLICVDYIQICHGSGKGAPREQEIAEISGGLKEMAKEEGAAVLALAQLSRKVDDRPDHRPSMSDLRESGALEQDCDTALFIYREERYVKDEEARKKVEGKTELIVGKQRNGPTGTVPLTWRGALTRFENAAPSEVFGEGM